MNRGLSVIIGISLIKTGHFHAAWQRCYLDAVILLLWANTRKNQPKILEMFRTCEDHIDEGRQFKRTIVKLDFD